MRTLIFLLSLLLLFPAFGQTGTHSFLLFQSGYGPEDMVIDSLSNPPRLLVSCSSRRPDYPYYAEIEAINPDLGIRKVMTRSGEPAGLKFRPHGISLTTAGEIQYLYVISHDDEKGTHAVIRYQIEGDTLLFVEVLSSRLLVSPNALQAFPDGSLLVCNDAGERNSMKEKIFRQKKGNILLYDGHGNWSIVAKDLGMPCGLTGIRNRIFVSATLENVLYSYQFSDGQLSGKQMICKITGPDNIRLHQGNLIVTSHSKPLKFVRHVKRQTSPSPSLVVSVNPLTGSSSRLFYDNGDRISAASVALVFNGRLVIGQIFEPGIGLAGMNK